MSEVTFKTDDGLTLAANLYTSDKTPEGAPGVVLIHQFHKDRFQWGSLPSELVEKGCRVLAIDLRGHGDSDPYSKDLKELLTDPAAAPKDVDAAITWIKEEGKANPDRIAVIGTSIGANLALVASEKGWCKTAVALSGRREPAESLAGKKLEKLGAVFFAAAQEDPGDYARDAEILAEEANPSQKVIYGGSEHGIALLEAHEDLKVKIIQWLGKTL